MIDKALADRIYNRYDWADKGIAPLGLAIPMIRLHQAAADHTNAPNKNSDSTRNLVLSLILTGAEYDTFPDEKDPTLSKPTGRKPPAWNHERIVRKAAGISHRLEHIIESNYKSDDPVLGSRINHTLLIIRACLPGNQAMSDITDQITNG